MAHSLIVCVYKMSYKKNKNVKMLVSVFNDSIIK